MTLQQKMTKCRNSLNAHAGRGNMISNQRSYQLIDRYQELRDQLIEADEWNEWLSLPENAHMAPDHNAYDYFG